MSLGRQPVDLWQEYPRYLKALLLRLDRLPNNHSEIMLQLTMSIHGWTRYLNSKRSKIKELYLMLEEFRISLFSQPMKTKMPISPTRLQKLWDRLGIS